MQEFEDIEIHKTSVSYIYLKYYTVFKMIGTNNHYIERLYLDKRRNEEVYVDTCPLPQHQIDGIRFLFRQFKHKKQGIILSNPEGYGKTVQVVLFLNAVRKILKNPVLILCKDDKEVNKWNNIFKMWTKYTEEDIVVDPTNIFVKKSIFIKNTTEAASYSRRDWSVVVVKNDLVPKDLLKVSFNTAYKIWLTTIDMRKDIQMLNAIYSWLYSEKKFNVENFLTSITDIKGSLNKLLLLDAFLEDIVIARNDFMTPFKTDEILPEDEINISPKISKKNKDATGTKIKRTKRKVEEDNAMHHKTEYTSINTKSKYDLGVSNRVMDTQNFVEDFRIDKCCNSNNRFKMKGDGDEKDVDKFIRDKDALVRKDFEFIDDTNSIDANGEDISFAEAVNDIIDNENGTPLKDNGGQSKSKREFSFFNETAEVQASQEIEDSNNIESEIPADINIIKNESNENRSVLIGVSPNNETNIKVETHIDSSSKNDATITKSPNNKSEIGHQKKENTRNDLDSKIYEMEEKAMKKFKGSILDSLF
ncbi:unnamed protein product [Parnassius apollo]|uniref:(apollo) hypothetical protein n=1 Tax=Parnassius apollo TaxID=110799 RepID=A0A8S3Y5R2_PARAO|nr:unnamed protein product [Parnassius apollo]